VLFRTSRPPRARNRSSGSDNGRVGGTPRPRRSRRASANRLAKAVAILVRLLAEGVGPERAGIALAVGERTGSAQREDLEVDTVARERRDGRAGGARGLGNGIRGGTGFGAESRDHVVDEHAKPFVAGASARCSPVWPASTLKQEPRELIFADGSTEVIPDQP